MTTPTPASSAATSTTTARQPRKKRYWKEPAGLILLSVVPLIAGASRITELASDPEITEANARFVSSPAPVDGRRAVELARRFRPDVCLFDIRMPLMDGIEATRALAGPDVTDPLAVVIITTFDHDEYLYAALRAGARGFLLKDAGAELLAAEAQSTQPRPSGDMGP